MWKHSGATRLETEHCDNVALLNYDGLSDCPHWSPRTMGCNRLIRTSRWTSSATSMSGGQIQVRRSVKTNQLVATERAGPLTQDPTSSSYDFDTHSRSSFNASRTETTGDPVMSRSRPFSKMFCTAFVITSKRAVCPRQHVRSVSIINASKIDFDVAFMTLRVFIIGVLCRTNPAGWYRQLCAPPKCKAPGIRSGMTTQSDRLCFWFDWLVSG